MAATIGDGLSGRLGFEDARGGGTSQHATFQPPKKEGLRMQISSRFTVGVHTLLCVAYFAGEKVTSGFIAASVNANPVVIRRTLGQLKTAGLVTVEAGVGGTSLARRPEDITLLDVFDAVEATPHDLFSFHDNPNPACPVGGSIHAVLDSKLASAQESLRTDLRKTTLADLLAEVRARSSPTR